MIGSILYAALVSVAILHAVTAPMLRRRTK